MKKREKKNQKKQLKIPEDFGSRISWAFSCAADGCGNDWSEFIIDFCREVGKKSDLISQELHHFKEDILPIARNEMEKEALEREWDTIVDVHQQAIFALGFTLGQGFDLVDPDALKEIDFVWRMFRERNILSLFPRA